MTKYETTIQTGKIKEMIYGKKINEKQVQLSATNDH